jgi:hypothetical protein
MLTIENGSLVEVSSELSFGIGKQREVQLLFLRAEVVAADDNSSRWQAEVIRFL